MRLNTAAATGFLLCMLALFYGVATNGGLGAIVNLLHFPSAVITFGGAIFAALMTADSFAEFGECFKSFGTAFLQPRMEAEESSEQVLVLADLARKEGLLALEEQAGETEDAFLKKGIMLVVDGTAPELVRDILESEMLHRETNGKRYVKFWQDLGGFGPAWGMIGTLLGLINMMRSMGNDPGAVGEGMSLALITTLYGSVLANWVCIPVSRKLEKYYARELLHMEICVEGILSIQAGENPRVIREKLNSVIELRREEEAA